MRHRDYKLRHFDFATRLVGLLRLMPHSKKRYVCPEPLIRLMNGDERTKLKKLFIDRRKEFEANPDAAADLKAYQRNDNKHNYTVL